MIDVVKLIVLILGISVLILGFSVLLLGISYYYRQPFIPVQSQPLIGQPVER